jgi:hypothetical protein
MHNGIWTDPATAKELLGFGPAVWVVCREDIAGLQFADQTWLETKEFRAADRFATKADAVTCAAAMRMLHGGKWEPMRFRVAEA